MKRFLQQLFCKHHYRFTEIDHDGKNTVECKYCGKTKVIYFQPYERSNNKDKV